MGNKTNDNRIKQRRNYESSNNRINVTIASDNQTNVDFKFQIQLYGMKDGMYIHEIASTSQKELNYLENYFKDM